MESSGLSSPPRISQHLGEPCTPESASSKNARHRTFGERPYNATPTTVTKASRAIVGILTNRSLGAAANIGGMRCGIASLSSQTDDGKEPISSDFATPIEPAPSLVKALEEAKYPMLEQLPSLRSSSNASSLGSDIDELHAINGVPLIPSFHQSDAAPYSDIDTWVGRVMEATSSRYSSSPKQSGGIEDLVMNDVRFSPSTNSDISLSPSILRVSPSRLKADLQSVSRASSNKENLDPSRYSSSPSRPPRQYREPKSMSRFRETSIQPALERAKALHSAHPLTPQGYLSIPPKRKRPRVDGIVSSKVKAEMQIASKDFSIHEDQLPEALAQLSPDVERHRKGRGPRKERCTSYWDEDILQIGLHYELMDVGGNDEVMEKGEQVSGGSKLAVGVAT